MGETTGISWADATLNFWIGCTKISPACDFCYAEGWGHRFGVKWGSGEARRFTRHWTAKAARLERQAQAKRARGEGAFFCFSNSLSDIFDKEIPDVVRRTAFDAMRASPSVTYLLLTKRAPNIVRLAKGAGGLPPNAALGVTVVSQDEADRDVPTLLAAKAALRPAFAFLSIEPLLGPVELQSWLTEETDCGWCDDGHEGAPNRCARKDIPRDEQCPRDRAVIQCQEGPRGPDGCPEWVGVETILLDWVIAGGESGTHARPSHPDWFRSLRDQCAAAGVPFHFKQWGVWAPSSGAAITEAYGSDAQGQVAWPDGQLAWGRAEDHGGPGRILHRYDRGRAGRLLDGAAHDARPEVAS